MKNIFSALFFSLFGATALMTSCSDVPAPYEIMSPGDIELVGDGSKDNPYNVATAAMKQDGSTAWVQGYIVGVMETNVDPFSPNFAAPFNTESNLMIADSPEEQNKKNCIIVQLPVGDIRTALNLKAHADNQGKPVSLQGKLTSYFSSNGLKEVSAAIFNGEEIGSEAPTDKDNPFGLDASNPVESFKADFQEQPDFVPEGNFNSNKNYNYELKGWKNVAFVGDRKWSGVVNKDNTKYIEASANKGKEERYEIWFVSPALRVDALTDKKVSFDCAGAYFNEKNSLKVFFLELVDGKMVQEEIPVEGMPTSKDHEWVRGLSADIAKYSGKVGFIGFQYISYSASSTTYRLDNIQTGNGEGGEVVPPAPGEDPFGLDASKTFTEFIADFEDITDFNQVYTKEGWVNKALAKGNPWQSATFKEDKYIKMNTFNTQNGDNVESWFITPAFVVGNKSKLSFDCAGANFTADMHLKVFFLQKDASGKVSQEEIIVNEIPTSGNNYAWAKDINVDLSKYNGKTGFIGFQYTATGNGSTKGLPTYQIDNIKYSGENEGGEVVPPAPGEADIFISEYVEGSGMEKYIEIYNPTDKEIDLSAYTLAMHNYSKDGEGGNDSGIKSVQLSGTLAAKQTVVYKHSKAESYSNATAISDEVMNFNGNDPIILYKGTENIIDYLGIDNKGFGKDKTLRRKASVTKPSTTYNAEEWEEAAKNDVSNLGSHAMN